MGLLNRAAKEELSQSSHAKECRRHETFAANKLKEKISEYYKKSERFGCIVFQNREPGGGAAFYQKLTNTMGQAGSVLPLTQGRLLVLLPPASDRELIAHRLSRSLKAELLLSSETNSPESFFQRLESLS